ncbi:MAG: hypothetical protein QM764_20415 [Chitinophagaceae bacterium]
MKTEERVCKNCGEPIKATKGRRDRLFCNNECKNKYHNAKTYQEEHEISRIYVILRNNRRILAKMFERKDKDEIGRERLLKLGFDFDYHSHFVISKIKRNQFTFCFDYGYRLVRPDIYKVVKAFEYKAD